MKKAEKYFAYLPSDPESAEKAKEIMEKYQCDKEEFFLIGKEVGLPLILLSCKKKAWDNSSEDSVLFD